MATTKLERAAEAAVNEHLEAIDEAIHALEDRMRVFEAVNAQLNKLKMARRALLGVGSRTTGNAGSRVTQDEVIRNMTDDGPGTAVEIAERIGSTDSVIRGHLNRGKDRFLKRGDNVWFLRDPEAGINSLSDLPDPDDNDDEDE